MADKTRVITTIGAISALSLSAAAVAGTASNGELFQAEALDSGFMLDQPNFGDEGSCGEGSCGEGDEDTEEDKDKDAEGSCGEGACGEGHEADEDKDAEGSCGEGSCGEGSCGQA